MLTIFLDDNNKKNVKDKILELLNIDINDVSMYIIIVENNRIIKVKDIKKHFIDDNCKPYFDCSDLICDTCPFVKKDKCMLSKFEDNSHLYNLLKNLPDDYIITKEFLNQLENEQL